VQNPVVFYYRVFLLILELVKLENSGYNIVAIMKPTIYQSVSLQQLKTDFIMLKKITLVIFIIGLFLLLTGFDKSNDNINIDSKDIVGTWIWSKIKTPNSEKWNDISKVFFGFVQEIKTEYKENKTFVEYKTKLSDGVSELNGQWRLNKPEGTLLMMNEKNNTWKHYPILKYSNDSMIIDMDKNGKVLLLKSSK